MHFLGALNRRGRWLQLRIALTVLPFTGLFFAQRLAAAQDPQASQDSAQPIRRTVDRVNIGVIITDAQGHFIEGLQRDDFLILDDGAEQPLIDFATIDEPAQVLLLIEAGPAVYLLRGGHLQAAFALLNGLSSGDRVAVARYAEAPQLICDFTADKRLAGSALGQLQFNVGFGSLNLSSSLSVVFDWLANVRGKKTVVLLSTGLDSSPPEAAHALLQRLPATDVRVLAVSLVGELRTPEPAGKKKKSAEKNSPEPVPFDQADHLLKQIAETSGGRAYFPQNASDFQAVYSEIAQLVRHEYSLAFAPALHDGKTHRLEVRIRKLNSGSKSPEGYRVDHRRQYLAPAS